LAMEAAINAIGYLASGPFGTVITVLSIIGLASVASFCYLVIQALVRKKGVYIKVGLNHYFPYISQGLA